MTRLGHIRSLPSLVLRSLSTSRTLSAYPAALVPISVGLIEGMPAKAMSLPEIRSSRAIPATEILTDGDWLAVGWIAAPAIPAQVIEMESWRNGTNHQLVGNSVGVGHWLPSPASVDLPITLVEGSEPRPALSRSTSLNFGPETISQRTSLWHGYMVAGSIYNGA